MTPPSEGPGTGNRFASNIAINPNPLLKKGEAPIPGAGELQGKKPAGDEFKNTPSPALPPSREGNTLLKQAERLKGPEAAKQFFTSLPQPRVIGENLLPKSMASKDLEKLLGLLEIKPENSDDRLSLKDLETKYHLKRTGFGKEIHRIYRQDPSRYQAIKQYLQLHSQVHRALYQAPQKSPDQMAKLEPALVQLGKLAEKADWGRLGRAAVANDRGLLWEHRAQLTAQAIEGLVRWEQHGVEFKNSYEKGEATTPELLARLDKLEKSARLLMDAIPSRHGIRDKTLAKKADQALNKAQDLRQKLKAQLELMHRLKEKLSGKCLSPKAMGEVWEELKDFSAQIQKFAVGLSQWQIYIGTMEVKIARAGKLGKPGERTDGQWRILDDIFTSAGGAILELEQNFSQKGIQGLMETYQKDSQEIAEYREDHRITSGSHLMGLGTAVLSHSLSRGNTLSPDVSFPSGDRVLDAIQTLFADYQQVDRLLEGANRLMDKNNLGETMRVGNETHRSHLNWLVNGLGENREKLLKTFGNRREILQKIMSEELGPLQKVLQQLMTGQTQWSELTPGQKTEVLTGLSKANAVLSNQALILTEAGTASLGVSFHRNPWAQRLYQDIQKLKTHRGGQDATETWLKLQDEPKAERSQAWEKLDGDQVNLEHQVKTLRIPQKARLAQMAEIVALERRFLDDTKIIAEEAASYKVFFGLLDLEEDGSIFGEINEFKSKPYWNYYNGIHGQMAGYVESVGKLLYHPNSPDLPEYLRERAIAHLERQGVPRALASEEAIEEASEKILEETVAGLENFVTKQTQGPMRQTLKGRIRMDQDYLEFRGKVHFVESIISTLLTSGFAAGATVNILNLGKAYQAGKNVSNLAKLVHLLTATPKRLAAFKLIFESGAFYTLSRVAGHEGTKSIGAEFMGFVHTTLMLGVIGKVSNKIRGLQQTRVRNWAKARLEKQVAAGKLSQVTPELIAQEAAGLGRNPFVRFIHGMEWFGVEVPSFQGFNAAWSMADNATTLLAGKEIKAGEEFWQHLTPQAFKKGVAFLLGLRLGRGAYKTAEGYHHKRNLMKAVRQNEADFNQAEKNLAELAKQEFTDPHLLRQATLKVLEQIKIRQRNLDNLNIGRENPHLAAEKNYLGEMEKVLNRFLEVNRQERIPGIATFKPISEIQTKADKIANVKISKKQKQRYAEYWIHHRNPAKRLTPEEAHQAAENWADQVIFDARAHQLSRTKIYDTSLADKPGNKHLDGAHVDHHGRFKNDRNSTEQLLDHFQAHLEMARENPHALEAAKQNPAAMASARRGLQSAGVKNPTESQVAQIAAAIQSLNIREVTTDNLADGAWCVWISKNQARVLADPKLRAFIEKATHFEDFSAFGTEYSEQDPAVRLQAALFQKYGEILAKHKIIGSDRFTPKQAPEVMEQALKIIDQMIRDPKIREENASKFFQAVEAAKTAARKKGLIPEASRHEGTTQMTFFDLTQLGPFTVFQQWLALPRVQVGATPDSLQVSVVPMKPATTPTGETVPRLLQIVAIPNGRQLPSERGMLSVLEKINATEKSKAASLDLEANFWFGKDNVILPNPAKGGTLLTPREVAQILIGEGLFSQPATRNSNTPAGPVRNLAFYQVEPSDLNIPIEYLKVRLKNERGMDSILDFSSQGGLPMGGEAVIEIIGYPATQEWGHRLKAEPGKKISVYDGLRRRWVQVIHPKSSQKPDGKNLKTGHYLLPGERFKIGEETFLWRPNTWSGVYYQESMAPAKAELPRLIGLIEVNPNGQSLIANGDFPTADINGVNPVRMEPAPPEAIKQEFENKGGRVKETPRFEYEVTLYGDQRFQDTLNRLKNSELGPRLIRSPRGDAHEFLLKGRHGENLIRLILRKKPLGIKLPMAKKIFSQFKQQDLAKMLDWKNEKSQRGSYARRVLHMVGGQEGSKVEQLIKTIDSPALPAERKRAEEHLALMMAHLQEVPMLKAELDLMHQGKEILGNKRLLQKITALEPTGSNSPTPGRDSLSSLSDNLETLTILGGQLRGRAPDGINPQQGKRYEEYRQAQWQIRKAIKTLKDIGKQPIPRKGSTERKNKMTSGF